MRGILFSVGLVAIALGLLALALAASALHQILAAIAIMGGFTLLGIAALMHTIDAACDRLIKAIWTPPPSNTEKAEG